VHGGPWQALKIAFTNGRPLLVVPAGWRKQPSILWHGQRWRRHVTLYHDHRPAPPAAGGRFPALVGSQPGRQWPGQHLHWQHRAGLSGQRRLQLWRWPWDHRRQPPPAAGASQRSGLRKTGSPHWQPPPAAGHSKWGSLRNLLQGSSSPSSSPSSSSPSSSGKATTTYGSNVPASEANPAANSGAGPAVTGGNRRRHLLQGAGSDAAGATPAGLSANDKGVRTA
jgi:hypothetical protein